MADDFHTKLQAAIMKIRGEMPDVADAPISPGGTTERLMEGVFRTLNPGKMTEAGTVGSDVHVSPEYLAKATPAELEGTLTHELTHVRQNRRPESWTESFMSLFGPHFDWGQDPRELEAYGASAQRAVAQGQTPHPTPSFSEPGGWQRGDITLPRRTGVGNRYHP